MDVKAHLCLENPSDSDTRVTVQPYSSVQSELTHLVQTLEGKVWVGQQGVFTASEKNVSQRAGLKLVKLTCLYDKFLVLKFILKLLSFSVPSYVCVSEIKYPVSFVNCKEKKLNKLTDLQCYQCAIVPR